jgi:hypothetical protein
MDKQMIEQSYIENSEENILVSKKKFLLFVVLLFIAAVFIGGASLVYTFPFIGFVQLAALLLLGYLYAMIAAKKMVEMRSRQLFRVGIYFSVALFISITIFSIYKDNVDFLHILSLGAAFLLPITQVESWRVFASIPVQQKHYWFYTGDIPPAASLVYLENTTVRLKIITGNASMPVIESKTPTSLDLGTAFFYIVKAERSIGENDHIFMEDSGKAYGWLFYTKKYFRKVFLDPDATLSANRIKPQTTIFAERISSYNAAAAD